MSHSIPVTLSQLAPFKVRPCVVSKDPYETYNAPRNPLPKICKTLHAIFLSPLARIQESTT